MSDSDYNINCQAWSQDLPYNLECLTLSWHMPRSWGTLGTVFLEILEEDLLDPFDHTYYRLVGWAPTESIDSLPSIDTAYLRREAVDILPNWYRKTQELSSRGTEDAFLHIDCFDTQPCTVKFSSSPTRHPKDCWFHYGLEPEIQQLPVAPPQHSPLIHAVS